MRSTFLRLLNLVEQGDRWSLLWLGGALIINAGLEVLGVGLIFPFIQLVNEPSKVINFPILSDIYKSFNFASYNRFIIVIGCAFLLLVIIKNLWVLLLAGMQSRFLCLCYSKTSYGLYSRYLHGSYADISGRNSAELISIAENATAYLYLTVLLSFVVLVAESLVAAGVVGVMLFAEPGITVAISAVLGSLFALIYLMMRRHSESVGQEMQAVNTEKLRSLQQGLGCLKEVKVFGREQFFLDAYARNLERSAVLTVKSNFLQLIPRLVVETFVTGAIVMVIVMVLLQQRNTSEITAILGMFAIGAFRLIPSANKILVALHNIRVGTAALNLVDGDMAQYREEDAGSSSGIMPPFVGPICLDDVEFTFPGSERPALTGVSLSIEQGRSVGFVGPSGAGKSTLMDVILGVLRAQRGSVLVSGVEISRDIRGWQSQVGYVPQVTMLVDDTIRRNIAFGLDDVDIDDNKVWSALSMAQLDDFIAGLPDGLDTLVGERGVRLSGGQRQRIGIARALYHDPQILVMDEATSALDGETEQEITRAVDRLRGKKTLLIIAHRLSTVKHCDTVVVMKNGQIVDKGSFSELFGRCADFQRMVAMAEIIAGRDAESNALYD